MKPSEVLRVARKVWEKGPMRLWDALYLVNCTPEERIIAAGYLAHVQNQTLTEREDDDFKAAIALAEQEEAER